MRNTRAFTLIELLVVIAIIGIMAAIIQPMLAAASSKSNEFSCESHLKQIGIAAHIYAEDYGQAPTNLKAVDSVLQDQTLLSCPATSVSYFYNLQDDGNARTSKLASCVDPLKQKNVYPHRMGTCYLLLMLNGSVKTVSKR